MRTVSVVVVGGPVMHRLLLSRDLLSDTGSIFIQINDENLSLVHLLMAEVFKAANFIVHIPVKKKRSQKGGLLDPVNDYLIWFAKDKRVSAKPTISSMNPPHSTVT
jgi:adenine-specific DNA-methyltransferase